MGTSSDTTNSTDSSSGGESSGSRGGSVGSSSGCSSSHGLTGGGAHETGSFAWARPQVLAYCLLQALLYGSYCITYPETRVASIVVAGGYLLLLASRELLARLADQDRARELFSRCWVITCALVDGALWLTNRRAPLMSDLDTAGMLGIILLVMLEGMYMRVLGVRAWARLGAAACSVTLFAALPAPWSKRGQPHEALGLACAHAVGELAIWAVERRWAGGHEKTA